MITISDEILKSTGLTEDELRGEIACMVYAQNRFTMGQAKKFAGLNIFEFQKLLDEKEIPLHYSKKDFENDLIVINKPYNEQ